MPKLKEEDIVKRIKEKFSDANLDWVEPENGDRYLFVPSDKVDEIAEFLKSDAALSFDYLNNVSALDTKEHLEVTYHLYSYAHRHSFVLKVKTPRADAVVKSISALFGTANFQEREVFDHFGMKFQGHPDLRRILLPDDWVGFPLLKDYKEGEEYNGIGTTRPSMI